MTKQKKFPKQVYAKWYYDGDEMPWLETTETPEEQATIGEVRTVAVYQLVKIIKVSVKIKMTDVGVVRPRTTNSMWSVLEMKGIVLTLDAIMAFIILVIVISLLVSFRIEPTSPFLTAEQLHSLSEDAINILSKSTFREVINKTILTDPTLFNIYYNQKRA